MTTQINTTTTLTASFGTTRTGWTVEYRILYSNLTVKTDWTSVGVIEIGYGAYGISFSINEIMAGFIQIRASYSGSTSLYLIDSLNITTDFITNITNILKIETGRWRVLNNQMIFYDTNGSTPIYTFDLKDTNGNPAETNVMERTPV